MQNWTSQLRKGVTEIVVLGALRQGEAYGYELLQRINGIEGLSMTESTVYPMLARLKREDFVSLRNGPSPSGPPRRYYKLTAAGKRRLSEMLREWRSIGLAIHEITGDGK